MGQEQDRQQAWTTLLSAVRAAGATFASVNATITADLNAIVAVMALVSENTISAQNIADINAALTEIITTRVVLQTAIVALQQAVAASNAGLAS